MGNTLSCFVDFYCGRKSPAQAPPVAICAGNTGKIPSGEIQATKLPTIIIKAVPSKMDCSDTITAIPTDKATSAQSTTTGTNTIPNNATKTASTTDTTTTPPAAALRHNLPSCPTTFTKPWTFSPWPPTRKIQLQLPHTRGPLPTSNASKTAGASPQPKITPVPVAFPAMDPVDSNTTPVAIPSRIVACLAPVRLKNEYVAHERLVRRHMENEMVQERRGQWRNVRMVVCQKGVDVVEWEVGAMVDGEDEDGGKGGAEEGEGKERMAGGKRRIRCLNEDSQGNTRGTTKLRSESEQVAWIEEWQRGKDERFEQRWDAFTGEDRTLMVRVMLACAGEEAEVKNDEDEGYWVKQIF